MAAFTVLIALVCCPSVIPDSRPTASGLVGAGRGEKPARLATVAYSGNSRVSGCTDTMVVDISETHDVTSDKHMTYPRHFVTSEQTSSGRTTTTRIIWCA